MLLEDDDVSSPSVELELGEDDDCELLEVIPSELELDVSPASVELLELELCEEYENSPLEVLLELVLWAAVDDEDCELGCASVELDDVPPELGELLALD